MSDELSETVSKTVCDMASAVGIEPPHNFVVTEASKNGDSYSGKVYRVVVMDKDCKEIRLIAKIPPSNAARRKAYNSAQHFTREKYMLEIVLPAFEVFQQTTEQSLQIFRNYPICKAASSRLEDEYILLDDLKAIGFDNVHRPSPMDIDRCRFVLEHLARLHAISFAMKDQQPQQFSQLTDELKEIIFVQPLSQTFHSFLQDNIGYVLTTLNGVNDSAAADKIRQFSKEYGSFMVRCCDERKDAVVLHGDCWMSNMMFKDKDKKCDEMKFLDWQVSRYGTVAIDLSYFIFCCTDASVRQHLPELLVDYHNELLARITALGSDGSKLFPIERLQWHMTNYARFGFGMAVMTLHATCCESSELANVHNVLDSMDDLGDVTLPMVRNPVYRQRMADVCRDMIRFGYL